MRRWTFTALLLGVTVVILVGQMAIVPGLPDVAAVVLNIQRTAAGIQGTTALRAEATFRYPNEFAAYLLLIVPLLVTCLLNVAGRLERIAFGTLALAGTWLLVLTYTRGALIALLIVIPLLLWVLGRWRLGIVIACAELMFLALLLIAPTGATSERFSTLLGFTDSGYTSRLAAWAWAWHAFVHHPLFGVGVDNLRLLPDAPILSASLGLRETDAENLLLNVLAEMGIVGLLAVVVCLGGALRRCWRGIRSADWLDRSWNTGLVGGLGAFLIYGLVDPVLLSGQVTGLLCLVVGLAGPFSASVAVGSRTATATRPREAAPTLEALLADADGDDEDLASRVRSRVVLLVNSRGLGGAEKHSLKLASWLQLRGVRVLVVCPPRAAILPELIERGLVYREVHLGMNLGRWRGYLGTLAFLNPFSRDESNRQLLQLAREMPSIFICPFPREQILTGRLSKRHGLRTIWILHGPLHFAPHRLLFEPLLLRRSHSTSAVVAVSRRRAEEAISAGMPAERVVVIPNTVDSLAFDGANADVRDSMLVAVISRLVRPKGVQYAIAAMPRILQACPGARLEIAGTGRYKRTLMRQVQRLHLGDHVRFLGFLRNPDALARRAAVFVFPSVDAGEALPTVILEAQACATPVVASLVAGVPEIVRDESTGLLVWPRDVDGLADAVIALLRDPARAHEMGTAAQQMVESEYTFAHVGQRFLRLLGVVEHPPRLRRDSVGSAARADAEHRSRLLSNTGILVSAKVLTALATALWTVLAARALLPAEYGTLMLCAGLVDLGAIVTDAGFTAVATRELAQARRASVGSLTGTLIYLKLGLGLLAALVTLGVGLILPFGQEVSALMIVFAPSLFFVSLNSLTLVFRARLTVGYAAAVAFVAALVSTYATVVAYWIAPAALAFAQVRLVVALVGGLLAVGLVVLKYRPRLLPDLRLARRLTVGALPFGAALVLNILYYRIDVPILGLMTNSTQVAIYTSAYRILDLVTLVPVSAAAIALPLMASIRTREPHQLGMFVRQYLELAAAAGLLSALVLTLVSRPLLAFLYADRYNSAEATLVVLAWAGGAAFVTNVFAPLAVALNRQRALLFATALGLVANIGLNVLLIPALGPLGSAVATLATELIVTVPLAVMAVRALRFRVLSRPIVAAGVATGAAFAVWWVMLKLTSTPAMWLPDVLALAVWVVVLVGLAPQALGSLLAAVGRRSDELADAALTGVSNVVVAVRTEPPVADGVGVGSLREESDRGGEA